MLVYVGTFTTPSRGGHGEGIYVFRMEDESGELTHVQTLAGVANPSFLALHPSGRFLYCNNAVPDYQGQPTGAVSAFQIDAATGQITFLNSEASGGTNPAHVSVHPSGRWVFAANYGSGSLGVLPLREDGRLGPATDVVQHAGPPGPNEARQEGPHAHQIVVDPAGRFVLANDLGLDRTFVYRLDERAGKLRPNDPPFAQASPGAGPRHLAFHPSQRWVYVINELASTIAAFRWDAERGTLEPFQSVSTLPDDFHGRSTTAQVLVHPDGRFVYGSNRGHDSIAVFGLDPESGRLTPIAHESSRGRIPRNFNFDPSGRFLYAANQDDDTIVQFRVDRSSGRLTPTGHVARAGSPVCLLFAGG